MPRKTTGELIELYRPDLTRDLLEFWIRRGWVTFESKRRGSSMNGRLFPERAVRKIGLLVQFYREGYAPDRANELADDGLHRAGRPTVLIIEDNRECQEIMGYLLDPHFNIVAKYDSESAIAYLRSEPAPSLVSVDLKLPARPGSEPSTEVGYDLLRTLAKIGLEAIIVASCNTDDPARLAAFDPSRILRKPFDWQLLVKTACSIIGVPVPVLELDLAGATI